MPPRKLLRHLVWLESFTAAVEAGSIEAAAEHLGVARSVVSPLMPASASGRLPVQLSQRSFGKSQPDPNMLGGAQGPRPRCTRSGALHIVA